MLIRILPELKDTS